MAQQISYDTEDHGPLEYLEIAFSNWDEVDRIRAILDFEHPDSNMTMNWTNATLTMKVSEWKRIVSFDISKRL